MPNGRRTGRPSNGSDTYTAGTVFSVADRGPQDQVSRTVNAAARTPTATHGAQRIGWIDAHLLCATAAAGVPIWTRDARLRKQAARCGLLPVTRRMCVWPT